MRRAGFWIKVILGVLGKRMDLPNKNLELNQKNSERRGSLGRLLKNATFNSGAWGINAIVTLVSTPIIVYKLTIEGYGIYALLSSLVGYYSLMDLGIGQGVTKFIAEYNAKGNHDNINQSINGALIVQTVTGMIASIILIIFAAPILHLLRVSPQFWSNAMQGMYVCAIGFLFMMIADTLAAVLMGLQRYDLTSTVGSITNVILTSLIVFALILGAGLKEVLYLTAASGFVTSFTYVIILRKLIPYWHFSWNVNWKLLLNLFSFSSYLFISKVSNLFSNYIVRFFVGTFLGPAMVTYYVVPAKLINAVGSLTGGAAVVLFPFASELGSLRDSARIEKLFLNGSRMYSAVSIPLFLTLYVAARPILTIWMGPEFAETGCSVLGLLSLASLFGALTTVPNLITMGLGYSRVVGIYSILNVLMYAICLPLFTIKWGIQGTALAMLIVALPSIILISYEAKFAIHTQVQTYLRFLLGFHVLPFIISILLGLLVASFAFPSTFVAGLVPIVFCFTYFLVMAVVGVIPFAEWMGRILEAFVPRVIRS